MNCIINPIRFTLITLVFSLLISPLKLILAAAKSSNSSNLGDFDLALSIFKSLHADEGLPDPNSATYEYFIQGCSRLLPEGQVQTKLVTQAFKLCRHRGLVTPLMIRQTHSFIPELKDELEKKRAPSFVTMGDKIASHQMRDIDLIPESWCSGVPEKYRKRKVEFGERYSQL